MTIDPVIQLVLRIGLGLLFVQAAAHKLRDVDAFRRAVANYRLFAPLWAVPVGALLIGAEIAVAFALWLPRLSAVAALTAAALLLLYAAAMAVNLARGRRDVECGCSGPAQRQPIRAALVVRNAGLALLALLCALPLAARPLTWLDLVTVAAAVLGAALCWIAADGLFAAAARAAAWRQYDAGAAGA